MEKEVTKKRASLKNTVAQKPENIISNSYKPKNIVIIMIMKKYKYRTFIKLTATKVQKTTRKTTNNNTVKACTKDNSKSWSVLVR